MGYLSYTLKNMKSIKYYLILTLLSLSILSFIYVTLPLSEEGTTREYLYTCSDCNILLITVDTLRSDHLSCYGYERNTTSAICAFADESMLFENAYSQAPSTIPALRSMMTGKVISNEDRNEILSFYYNTTYIAEILNKRGYHTHFITDHEGLIIERDESEGFNTAALFRGIDTLQNFGDGETTVNSHNVTEAAKKWLDENSEERFFLWLHYFDPHYNFNPLPEYDGLFGFDGDDCGRIYNGIDIKVIRSIQRTLTEKEVNCLKMLYDTEIFYTDKHIGMVLDKIKKLGLDENTLVMITADHGEEFLERSRIGHEMTVYNELIHVPLIIRYPLMDSGLRVSYSIGTSEIFFILNRDNFGFLRPDTEVISRSYHFYEDGRSRPNEFTVTSGIYKYIFTKRSGKEEFFNLLDDPDEKRNIQSPKKSELEQFLIKWLGKNHVEGLTISQESLKAQQEIDEIMRGLGYMV